ncbi:MAG: nucleotidyl transferase AbiEii/AbiGii toxin family protein, partial [Chitinophagaceae bacterium]|nr:nucleotidyl transferase AbiEii/AbiGii toxin family protein [Chitinophagaceae bacterium]
TGIRPHAIEKDWWVTVLLKAIFDTLWALHLVFKGGTSLTKSWKLIQRFSEGIDLAIDKEFLGFKGPPNKSKIERLRRNASKFVSGEFKEGLEKALLDLGVPADQFHINALFAEDSIRDPQVLELQYVSVLEPDPNPYLKEKVLIEVGARSLLEPSSAREITSILSEVFPDASFSTPPFLVQTVDPKRTFLEKAFLLHELFYKSESTKQHDRMSRHLYDLECLMHTEHATAALEDEELYNAIIQHREAFNKVTGVDYGSHYPASINFLPSQEQLSEWESDYKAMQENMIYGKSLAFADLIANLKTLMQRFRNS